MTYVGFYELEVTNVFGKNDTLTIRLIKKPSFFTRFIAKTFLGMMWYDKTMEMIPSERQAASQKKTPASKPRVKKSSI